LLIEEVNFKEKKSEILAEYTKEFDDCFKRFDKFIQESKESIKYLNKRALELIHILEPDYEGDEFK